MTFKMILAAIGTVALLTAADAATQKPRTEKSLECSKQADSKNLHGKPRKTFMRSCKKA